MLQHVTCIQLYSFNEDGADKECNNEDDHYLIDMLAYMISN